MNTLTGRVGAGLMLAALISACSAGPRIDRRTGEPMMAGPQDNRNLSLESFELDFFGEYRVRHSFITGVNINRCYQGAPSGVIKFVTIASKAGRSVPAIVTRGRGGVPGPSPIDSMLIGYPKSNAITLHDGTPKLSKWIEFNELCSAKFAGGNAIYFEIHASASESMAQNVERVRFSVSDANRQYQANHFIREPYETSIGGNEWLNYSAYIPSPVGDGMEVWMTPVGGSGYYLFIRFNFINSEREKNSADYQRARALLNGILKSVVIDPKLRADM